MLGASYGRTTKSDNVPASPSSNWVTMSLPSMSGLSVSKNSRDATESARSTHTTKQHNHHHYTIRPATEADLAHLPAIEQSAGALFRSVPELAHLADDEPTGPEQHRQYLEQARKVGFDGGVIVAVPATELDVSKQEPEGGEVLGGAGNPVAFVALSCYRYQNRGTGGQDHETTLVVAMPNQEGEKEGHCFLHIHEMSVHTDHQRRGLAKRLLMALWDEVQKFNGRTEQVKESGEATERCIAAVTLTTFRDVPFNAPFYARLAWEEIPADRIEREMGLEGWKIWEEEQRRFAAEGLAQRRCWMTRRIDGWAQSDNCLSLEHRTQWSAGGEQYSGE